MQVGSRLAVATTTLHSRRLAIPDLDVDVVRRLGATPDDVLDWSALAECLVNRVADGTEPGRVRAVDDNAEIFPAAALTRLHGHQNAHLLGIEGRDCLVDMWLPTDLE